MNFPAEERKHDSEANQVMVGWTTTASRDEAETLAHGLVEAGLVACAQVDGPVTSIYRWKGAMEAAQEYRLTLKFAAGREGAVEAWIQGHHSYETPEWIYVVADGAAKNYLNWVVQAST